MSLLAAILAEHTGAEEADTMTTHRQSYQLRNTALKYNLIAAEQCRAPVVKLRSLPACGLLKTDEGLQDCCRR